MQSYGIGPAAGTPPMCCMGACVITDAEHFTAVAEAIDPASAVTLINRYLETLFRPVYAHGGFISDVKGDGVLAVWTGGPSEPDLRAQVCRACLQMADTPALSRGARPAHGLRTRVGAYFGPIALARVGALAHYEYRAVGDTVNTASRLEALNKVLGTRLLVSAALVEGLDEFLFRDLGDFALRGKRNHVRVCELVATHAEASPRERRLCEDYAAALDAEHRGGWDAALGRWRTLCARNPEDAPSRWRLRHCQAAIERRADTDVGFVPPMAALGLALPALEA